MKILKDVFICHASEDKDEVVKIFSKALEDNDISYWLDEAEILWGDSLTTKVNEGLRISKYVLVVLSQFFISKPWPERELFAALNTEASSGEVKVLPLLLGDRKTRQEIINKGLDNFIMLEYMLSYGKQRGKHVFERDAHFGA
jgi:hypothetical protein